MSASPEGSVIYFTRTLDLTGTAFVDVGDLVLPKWAGLFLSFELANSDQILTDFQMLYQTHPGGLETHVLATGSDWGTPVAPMIASEGSLNTLAAAGNLAAQIDLRGIYGFKFQAKIGAATTTVTIKGGLSLVQN